MWLFDDILKRDNPGTWTPGGGSSASSWSTGGDPLVVIEKSTPEVIFGKDAPAVSTSTAAPVAPSATPTTPLISPVIDTSSSPLFNLVTEAKPKESESIIISPVVSPVSEVIWETSNATEVHPLFADMNPTPVDTPLMTLTPEVEAPVVAISPIEPMIAMENVAPPSTPTPETTHALTHPMDFIDESLARIRSMRAQLQDARAQKITEAEGYGRERDHQASLEEQAYEAAEKLRIEDEHAARMEELLEHEKHPQPTDEAPETIEEDTLTVADAWVAVSENQEPTPAPAELTHSVETALTGIAVASTVEQTIEQPAAPEVAMVPEESGEVTPTEVPVLADANPEALVTKTEEAPALVKFD